MAELIRRGPGCCVVNGRLAGSRVSSPECAPLRVTETPREPRATPSRDAAPDRARQLVQECDGRVARVALCKRYRINPAILDAPNAGVATMRLLNALRKILDKGMSPVL